VSASHHPYQAHLSFEQRSITNHTLSDTSAGPVRSDTSMVKQPYFHDVLLLMLLISLL
jgi:hypothetical protein